MYIKSFFKSGHFPTLISAFFYFDISFMIWVILGATSTFIVEDFNLEPFQKGLLVSIPILGGALLRIPMGLLVDRYGGKIMGIIGMIITIIPLLIGWLFANNINQIYALGILLGVAGASLSVALPLASSWYSSKYQGLAMGIVGAGNSGTVMSMLFAPRISTLYGWQSVFGFALIPLLIALLVFIVFAKENPNNGPKKNKTSYMSIIKHKETWWFCFLYSLSFGGFVGLSSFLSIFFVDQYSTTKILAGDFVTLVVFAGSLSRPIGGFLADRYGGAGILTILFGIVTILFGITSSLPNIYILLITLFLIFVILGMANGALFQVIPTFFPKQIGILTGLVGAAGGLGGFFLPNILGMFKHLMNSYSLGFLCLAFTSMIALINAYLVQKKYKEINTKKAA
ncbi:MFS transporter [Bacillus fungorum]|uniref:MFS transporter n=1 Tax=Bacillus fungorum TaxID=2039284 RepID=UPI0033935922